MRRPSPVLLLVLIPVVVLAGLVWLDRTFGFAGRGRDYVIRLDLPPPAGEVGLPPVEGPLDPSRPLVVIDAGHGGFDPGAGSGPVREKDVTTGARPRTAGQADRGRRGARGADARR
ncbi:N-acetylmuramoyl-L-alanine amidase [Novosphingobium sp. MW5]|nr:N-acetylmuramoyl-L-alanine amidase [Novosphingobium sp. MW5]